MSSKRNRGGDLRPSAFASVPFGVRPLPPLTNFEKDVFSYISGSRADPAAAAALAAASAAGVAEDEKFPVGVADALASEGITVLKQVLVVGGGGGGAAGGGADGGEDGHWKAWVKFDAPTMEGSAAEEAGTDSDAGGREGPSDVLGSLGLEVDKTIGGSGGPTVVESVTSGSVTHRWGVTRGMEIVETGANSVTIAMTTLFRGVPPLEEEGVVQTGPILGWSIKNIGGMMLADETEREAMARMLLSMFFRTKKELLKAASDWGSIQRPSTKAELRESQAKKQHFRDELYKVLGFDVKMKDLRGRPGLLQVDSTVEGFLADLYGLRVGDTLLSVNGHTLIDVSKDGFVAKVAEGLKVCASGKRSDHVLRFIVLRKKAPHSSLAGDSEARPPPSKGDTAQDVSLDGGDEPAPRAPAWDEPSPMDAVVPLPAGEKAAAVKSAARKRTLRAEVRARPDWWGPREKGTGVYMMKLRPANSVRNPEGGGPEARGRIQPDRGVEETKGGEAKSCGDSSDEAMAPGAFLREELQIGDMLVPAGAQLKSVRGIRCLDMTFQEARDLALSAGKGDELVFNPI